MKMNTGIFGQHDPRLKPPWGKPIWNISLYMWRIEGGIQQVHETNEPDKIAACLC
jgi:hypothetical protein